MRSGRLSVQPSEMRFLSTVILCTLWRINLNLNFEFTNPAKQWKYAIVSVTVSVLPPVAWLEKKPCAKWGGILEELVKLRMNRWIFLIYGEMVRLGRGKSTRFKEWFVNIGGWTPYCCLTSCYGEDIGTTLISFCRVVELRWNGDRPQLWRWAAIATLC